jgi:hypothetical protein
MDRITISDLSVNYRVGVPDEERAKPQRLLITVEMKSDFSAAAESDDLSKTIDYYAVTQRLLHFGAGHEWKLIEKLAVDLAKMILTEFHALEVSVRIKKFIIPETRYVSVEVTRQRATSR